MNEKFRARYEAAEARKAKAAVEAERCKPAQNGTPTKRFLDCVTERDEAHAEMVAIDEEAAAHSFHQVAAVYLIAAKERVGEVPPEADRGTLIESLTDQLVNASLGAPLEREELEARGALRGLVATAGLDDTGTIGELAERLGAHLRAKRDAG
jgi:hypothetical protein